jgi:hypothetical protein
VRADRGLAGLRGEPRPRFRNREIGDECARKKFHIWDSFENECLTGEAGEWDVYAGCYFQEWR